MRLIGVVLLALGLAAAWVAGVSAPPVAASRLSSPRLAATPLPVAPPTPGEIDDHAGVTVLGIDGQSVQCYRPETGTDACYIQWQYLLFDASGMNYVVSMTVSIDERIRANYQGFFQTSMYAPFDLHMPGFRVSCGAPGSGGVPEMGKPYDWTVKARDSAGLEGVASGQVICPADVAAPASVALSGPSSGQVGQAYNFEAATLPVTVTLPLTYVWTATGQAPITVSAGLSDTQSFTWSGIGVKELMVSVSNAAGVVTAADTITIAPPNAAGKDAFLPLVRR